MQRALILVAMCTMLCVSHLAFSAEPPQEEVINPHKEANECLTTPCEPGDSDCQKACDDRCASCHILTPSYADLSDPTPWNTEGSEIENVYSGYYQLVEESLADLCLDCHQGHFVADINHPVDILYEPNFAQNDLIDSPDGPVLFCDDDDTNCQVRCISCHKVHPSEEKGHQVAGLLRMSNHRSSLCTSCHDKGDSTQQTATFLP